MRYVVPYFEGPASPTGGELCMNFLPTITVPAAINGNCRAVFVCIQGISQCAHWEMHTPPACAIHIRICPVTTICKTATPKGDCFAWSCWAVFVCILFSLAGDGKTESRDFPVCALGNAHAAGVCDTHSNLPSDYHMQKQPPQRVTVLHGAAGQIRLHSVFPCGGRENRIKESASLRTGR